MEWIQTLAVLLVTAAVFRCINDRFLVWQSTIAMALLCAAGLLVCGLFNWAEIDHLRDQLRVLVDLVDDADPSRSLWMAVLAILLFATTTQISIRDLANEKWFILGVAAFTLVAGTVLIGNVLPWALGQAGERMSVYTGLLFGAMVSVTCLSVVLEALSKPGVRLLALISGEALFVTGLSALACTVIATAELGDGGTVVEAGGRLLQELLRGGLTGAVVGAAGCLCMPPGAKLQTRFLVSLAVFYASCALANQFGGFWPVAAVAAGMVLTLHRDVRKELGPIWRTVEETLTTMVLVVIGAQFVLSSEPRFWPIVVAILVVLLSRAGIVLLCNQLFGIDRRVGANRADLVKYMTWGGVHGAVPLALAKTIPHEGDNEFVFLMYAVVVFSLIVQGLTMNRV